MAVEEAQQQTAGEWGRVASVAGAVAATGVCLQAVLFLLDASVLPGSPPFRDTPAGRDADLAAFFGARAARQHDVLWDIVLRDIAGPVASVALIVLVYAVVRARGAGRAAPQAWAIVLSVGALLGALSDLVFLSQIRTWGQSTYITDPPADMIAIGRASDEVLDVADMLNMASGVAVAAGLVGISVLAPRGLRVLARVVAAVLLLSVVAALLDSPVAYGLLALVSGVVLVPVLLFRTGRWVAGPA